MLFETVEFIFKALRLIYKINSTIGFYIVQTIIGTYYFILYLFNNIYLLINVLVEDFHYFLMDISNLLQDIYDFTCRTYDLFTEPFSFIIDDKTKSFLWDIFSGKLIIERMEVGKTILHKTKDGIVTVLVFLWETTAFFFTILQYLNKAPYLVILFIAETFDAMIYSIKDFYYSLTFQMFISFLINITIIFIIIKYNMHRYLLYKMKRITNESYQKLLPAFSRKSHNLLIYFINVLYKVKRNVKEIVINSYKFIITFLRSFGRKVISKTPTKAALKIQLEQEKLERLCIVCMDAKRNTMLLNCRHLVLCMRCAEHIVTVSRECPVCRTFILDVINVYT
ncbi:hypothetical protein O3M35_002111 [Rhynocoris fuscipes]|uniref:RING-type domain-containing protein n=1 Tax=Rhynocoris fuscipes TaxID=488301 RepID=A0AAW1CTJ4_9HEMI